MTEIDTPDTEQVAADGLRFRLERQVKNGADWFFWIAGLSVINSLAHVLGIGWSFFVGLGATQIVDGFVGALAAEFGAPTAAILRGIGLLVSLGLAGVLATLGFFARKGHKWSFVVGMLLYALDALIFLAVGAWGSFGFHLFALFWISIGLTAKTKLDRVERGDVDVFAPAPRPLITKGPRPRSYWVRLGLVAGIALIPLLLFLVILFVFM
jgi:hypothetical protein